MVEDWRLSLPPSVAPDGGRDSGGLEARYALPRLAREARRAKGSFMPSTSASIVPTSATGAATTTGGARRSVGVRGGVEKREVEDSDGRSDGGSGYADVLAHPQSEPELELGVRARGYV
jgi:hypothetical protein